VDLEDYYHVYAFRHKIKYSEWENYPSRIEFNTERLLKLLGDVKGTFFVLGWIAKHYPNVVKAVQRAGHEIACHGLDHEPIFAQSREEFRMSVRETKALLEDLTGEEVLGFRAPTFSIVKETLWALDILMEEGIKYDSSIFPILHDRYGIPSAERFPFIIRKNGMELIEFPMSTFLLFGKKFPVCGGGYTRLLPYAFTKRNIQVVNKGNKPVVFYFHPWEIDYEQPRVDIGSLGKFRHYHNLDKNEEKISRLLKDFSFKPFREIIGEYIQNE